MNDLDFYSIKISPASWEKDSEQLKRIRFTVFVDEQQVPSEIEIDEHDADSHHWLAYSPEGEAIGTARLESNGKVGRMAVMKSHRGKGIGAALMRRIILDASAMGMTNLHLHAQCHARDFYQQFGFEPHGDIFDEAGIDHIEMAIDLGSYRHLADKDSSVRTTLETPNRIAEELGTRFEEVNRQVMGYLPSLHLEYLRDSSLLENIAQFCLRHPHCKLQLLVDKTDLERRSTPAIISLQQKLSEHCEIRVTTKDTPESDFFIVFDEATLFSPINENDYGSGVLTLNYRARCRTLTDQFRSLWNNSVQHPATRHVPL
ncbi:GNAT family N-acetyltransferase [Porticoccaceae bacterium LTM1]|nr:GNAT family N-acetyltransferase [Porticoccaceae bacterium LTM1]